MKDEVTPEYVGWIPCVSGHLDFARMEVGLHGVFMPQVESGWRGLFSQREEDKNRACVNFSAIGYPDGHRRKIMLQSWVDWRDTSQGDGQTRVIVCAEVEASDLLDERHLKGRVLVFPRAYKEKYPEDHRRAMGIVGALEREFEDSSPPIFHFERFEKQSDAQKRLNQKWEDVKELLKENHPLGVSATHVYCIEFTTEAHGLVFLRVIDRPDIDDRLSGDDRYTICRQVFYYLKYGLHKHKHHGEKADALTTVVRWGGIESGSSEFPTGTEEALKLIGQLKRELTSIKREQQENGRIGKSNPLGIAGYSRALITTCAYKGWLDERMTQRELSWLEGVSESFKAQYAKYGECASFMLSVKQRIKQWLAIGVTVLSLMMLTWVNLNQSAVRMTDKKHDSLPFVIDWVNVAPNYFVPVLLIFAMGLFWASRIIQWILATPERNPLFLRKIFRQSWIVAGVKDALLILAAGLLVGSAFFLDSEDSGDVSVEPRLMNDHGSPFFEKTSCDLLTELNLCN